MIALYKKPGEAPDVIETDGSLEDLQRLVGGYIETFNLDDIVMIFNEEGKLNGMLPNFYVEAIDDIIYGPVVFMRQDGEELVEPTLNDIKWIRRRLGWRLMA